MTDPPDPAGFLASTALVPIEIVASDGRVRYVGSQACDLLGYPLDAWHAPDFWSARVVPDDQATMTDVRRNTVEARGHHEVDYRMERADGRVVWVAELLRYAECGAEATLRGFLWDVSGRKRQEVALWKREERVRGLLRKAPDAMVLTDIRGGVINMNDQAEALFDYSLGEIVGSGIEHLLPEPLRPRLTELRAAFERDPERGSVVEGQAFSVQRSDGSEIPVELSLSLVSAAGERGRILWSFRDLTVRRRVEAQRKTPAGRRRRSSDPRPMACSVDEGLRLVDADESFMCWAELEAGALSGRPLDELFDAGVVECLRPGIESAMSGSAARCRCQVRGAGRVSFRAAVGVAPRRSEDGRLSGCSLIFLPV